MVFSTFDYRLQDAGKIINYPLHHYQLILHAR
jgi:hypothetical protein